MSIKVWCAVLFVLVALVTLSSAQDGPICPPYADVPWYDDNSTLAPFTWCKSGDVGRIPVPLDGFPVPSWANMPVCGNNNMCRGVLQARIYSGKETSHWTHMMALYAANTSVLVVSPLSMLMKQNASVLDFGIGPITSFRLLNTDDGDIYGVLLQTGPKTAPTAWYLAWLSIDRFEELYSIQRLVHINELYANGVNLFDVNYYIEDHQLTLVVSTSLAWSANYQIDFVRANAETKPLLSIFSRVGATLADRPEDYTLTPLKVTTFMQAGALNSIHNRTLITVHDDHYVHVLGTPEYKGDANPTTHTLEWFNPQAKTLVFYAPTPKRLFHAKFFSELEVRDGQETPYVWLAHVVDEPESDGQVRSILRTTLFPEFGLGWERITPPPQEIATPITHEEPSAPADAPIAELSPDSTMKDFARSSGSSSDASASQPISSYDEVSVVNPLGLTGAPCRWNSQMNFTGDCSQARPFKTLQNRVGRGIRQIEVRSIPKVAWLTDFLPPDFSLRNWTTLAVNVIFSIESTTLSVFAMDEKLHTQYDVRVEEMNNFEMLGAAHRLEVSQNGLHALPIVEKHAWELESLDRYNSICEKLKDPSSLPPFELQVLDPWKSACNSFHRPPAVSDFIQYLSMCPFGALCYTSNSYHIGSIYPGYYSPYPIAMSICTPGNICPLGVKRPCPYGFICPLTMQLIPTPCPSSSVAKGLHCFAEGLTAPIPTPAGLVPVYAHGPPLPSPPGTFTYKDDPQPFAGYPKSFDLTARLKAMEPSVPSTADTPAPHGFSIIPLNGTGLDYNAIQLARCAEGEYCPLGRDEDDQRKCPAGTYCPSPASLFPIQCRYNVTENFSSYCPAGSSHEAPCPAGSYCTGPASITTCIKPYYCPPGTMAPVLCPAGSYCPTPSKKIECPKRYFCVLGSIEPAPCAILSICPKGTKNNNANFILALVFLVVVAGLIISWRVVENRINKKRIERSRAMQEAEKLLAKARLQKQARSASGASSSLDPEDGASSDHNGLQSSSQDNDYEYDDSDDASSSLLGGDHSTASLAAQIDRDLNSRMPPVSFEVDIHFRDMGLKIKGTEKKVLDGVTGVVRHGRVTAVMGPSGAGKTTFMSTLAGKAHYGDRTGRIWLNEEKDSSLEEISKLVGFVPQDDIMLRELSVIEILNFNAKMRLESGLTKPEINDVVRRNIRLLGLYDIRHELIGDETKRGISGGQRKRVNIGMELVANPSVLFLDEPTSGLDATASLQVCAILRRVAEEAGMTVVAVIHQPRYDIFTMFHDVLLLGKGGRTVYLGPTKDAVAYFEALGFEVPNRCNPADFLIDVVSGSVPRSGFPEFIKEDLFDLWIEHQKKNNGSSETDVEPSDNELFVDYSDAEANPRNINGDSMDNDAPTDTFGSSSYVPSGRLGAASQPKTSSYTQSKHSRTSKKPAKKAVKLSTKQSSLASFQGGESIKSHGKRDTAGFFRQLWYFFVRSLLQQKRNWISILTDVILVLSSGITFGIVFLNSRYMGPPDASVCASMPVEPLKERCNLPIEDPLPQIALMTIIGLALPASMAALRVFGLERVVFWRESSVGSNTASYFFGKELSYLPSTLVLPLLYAGIFYNFTVPRMGFGPLYLIFLVTWFCATGFALVISIIVPPALATISTVVVIFGLSLFSSVAVRLVDLAKMWPPFSLISYVSFFRWLVEAYYTAEISHWSAIYKIESGLNAMGYKLGNAALDFGIPIAMGVAMRVIALVCLELLHRDQRK